MTFDEYQNEAGKTAIYLMRGSNLAYPTLGLCDESGEVAGKVKKLMRDHFGKRTPEWDAQVKKELGDVLWYLSAICDELELSLDDVARTNIEKLQSRQQRNKLHGDGDNR